MTIAFFTMLALILVALPVLALVLGALESRHARATHLEVTPRTYEACPYRASTAARSPIAYKTYRARM